MMEYKGYVGNVEFDPDAKVLVGRVLGIRDVVTFEADLPADVEREFHASVDDYLQMCKEQGERPDKPASGNFAVRLPPELHWQLAMLAEVEDVSLNALVTSYLAAEVGQRLQSPAVPTAAPVKAVGRTKPKQTRKARSPLPPKAQLQTA